MVIKRHFKKLITTTLVGITVLTPINKLSYAQSKNLIFNNINIEQGISQSTIEDIFQDSEGYIWLGTNDGLNRYNGYEFKNYNYEEYQNSISHNGITDITEDKYGNIWVNTVSGVNKINKKTEKISNYTEINGKIKEDSTTEIIVTKDNNILVGTYEGLNIYNAKEDRFDIILEQKDGILSSCIYSIDEDINGNIWIGTELGLNKLSKDFKVLETYTSESEIYNIFCDDENGFVWAGSDSSGLLKIDTKTKEVTQYINDIEDENSIPANQVGAIIRDIKGNLWVGTTNGLARYNEKNDSFDVYKNKVYDKNSLVYNDVRSIIEDREGVLWVGTYSGISIFDTESSIKYYNAGLDDGYLLSENMVHGIYEDDEGYLWIGSRTKGVNIIDRENNTSKSINMENNNVIQSNSINDITGYKDFIFVATDAIKN